MGERRGECTNGGDKVETEEAANTVEGRDNGDWVLGELEDLSSELRGFVSGVLGGHDGEEREAGGMGMGRGCRLGFM